MMRDDALNLHGDPVRTKNTYMRQIPILHVFDSDESESKEILAGKNLLQVSSTDKENQKSLLSMKFYGGDKIIKRLQKHQHKRRKRCN